MLFSKLLNLHSNDSVCRQAQEVQEGSRAASDQAGLQRGQYSDFLKYVANRGSAYKVFNETPSRPRADGPSIRDVARPGPYTNASKQISFPSLAWCHHLHECKCINDLHKCCILRWYESYLISIQAYRKGCLRNVSLKGWMLSRLEVGWGFAFCEQRPLCACPEWVGSEEEEVLESLRISKADLVL